VLNHEVLIIAMTAHAMKGDSEMCLEAGMNGYIAKPVTQHQLADVIRDVMGEARPAAGPGGEADAGRSEHDLLASFDGDGAFLGRVARLFLPECESLLTSVRHAAAARDREALRVAGHTLKGMVAVFGHKPAQEAALRLELMGRDGDLAEVDAAISRLEATVGALRDSLQRYLAAHPARAGESAT
jgi:CheY-like chemotaxis protein